MRKDKNTLQQKLVAQLIMLLSFAGLSKIALGLFNLSLFKGFTIPPENHVFDSFNNGAIVLFFALLLLYVLTNNYLLSVVIFSFSTLAIAFANNVKVDLRNEFITHSDLDAIFAFDTLLPAVSNSIGPIIIGVFFFISMCVLAIYGMKKLDRNHLSYLRLHTRLFFLVVLVASSVYFYTNVESINKKVFGYQLDEERTNINPVVLAQKNGFVSSYLQTISPTFMVKPEGYSKGEMKALTARYQASASSEGQADLSNEKTVLVLSESFISSTNYPDLLTPESQLPSPFIDKLVEESGGMITPKTIGGGTANTEFSILSGFTLSLLDTNLAIPFTDFYASSPNHEAINNLVEKSVGLHSHTSKLYNRKNIYTAIGFEGYRFLDEGIKYTDKLEGGKFVSDEAFFKEIEDVLPDYGFIHAMSIQNHYPYENPYVNSELELELNAELYVGKNDYRKEVAESFFKGIYETDKSVAAFLNKLEETDDNVNVIFYGDHLPGSVIPALPQYSKKLLETPFFIYRNHNREIEPLPIKISPAFLFPYFLSAGNYQKPGFYHLIEDLLAAGIGDVYPETVSLNDEIVPISDLPEAQQQLVKDYQWVQYDSLFGKNFAGAAFFK